MSHAENDPEPVSQRWKRKYVESAESGHVRLALEICRNTVVLQRQNSSSTSNENNDDVPWEHPIQKHTRDPVSFAFAPISVSVIAQFAREHGHLPRRTAHLWTLETVISEILAFIFAAGRGDFGSARRTTCVICAFRAVLMLLCVNDCHKVVGARHSLSPTPTWPFRTTILFLAVAGIRDGGRPRRAARILLHGAIPGPVVGVGLCDDYCADDDAQNSHQSRQGTCD